MAGRTVPAVRIAAATVALGLVGIAPGLTGCAYPREGAAGAPESGKPATVVWPSFRGPAARGVADGQHLPDRWDVATGHNLRWKRAIPGLAHSSPIVWGERIYLTSAVSSRDDASYRHGLYGSGDASDDRSPHRWIVLALDRRDGRVLWERTAAEGVPVDKRHIKATYANATPVTDGRYVVAMFGSEGLHAFHVDGRHAWSLDLGRLDAGAYDAPDYEWGSASSPIIHGDRVLVQADVQGDSFLMAVDLHRGRPLWRTERAEPPSWGTPTVYPGPPRVELIVNGGNFIRGYDPRDGRELWRLGGSSKITAPTPVFSGPRIVVASGRRPEKPIFVLRPGAEGDITLPPGATSSAEVVWSSVRRGPYMPTPLIYGDRLYVLANQGILDAYVLETGDELYRQRIPHAGGGFSASPVAADGKLYLSGEDGDVFVVRAGTTFELIARNPMGERLMATPALAHGTLYVRGEHQLFAVGHPAGDGPAAATTAPDPVADGDNPLAAHRVRGRRR